MTQPFDGRRECAVIGAENGAPSKGEFLAPSLSNERPSEILTSGGAHAEQRCSRMEGEAARDRRDDGRKSGLHSRCGSTPPTTTHSNVKYTVSIQSDPLEIYSGDLIESLFKTVERIQGL